MKKETAEAKLNALFGITEKVAEVKAKSTGKIVGITEDDIQKFREAQGLIYFLQAPALFTSKICDHCGSPFLVSRLYVTQCSYTCIEKKIEETLGVTWKHAGNPEGAIENPYVWDGNEPLWITQSNLEKAHAILSNLLEQVSDKGIKLPSQLPTPPALSQSEQFGTSSQTSPTSLSSDTSPITESSTKTPGPSTSRKRNAKRTVSFNT